MIGILPRSDLWSWKARGDVLCNNNQSSILPIKKFDQRCINGHWNTSKHRSRSDLLCMCLARHTASMPFGLAQPPKCQCVPTFTVITSPWNCNKLCLRGTCGHYMYQKIETCHQTDKPFTIQHLLATRSWENNKGEKDGKVPLLSWGWRSFLWHLFTYLGLKSRVVRVLAGLPFFLLWCRMVWILLFCKPQKSGCC